MQIFEGEEFKKFRAKRELRVHKGKLVITIYILNILILIVLMIGMVGLLMMVLVLMLV